VHLNRAARSRAHRSRCKNHDTKQVSPCQ
jgi:hypothetical protein